VCAIRRSSRAALGIPLPESIRLSSCNRRFAAGKMGYENNILWSVGILVVVVGNRDRHALWVFAFIERRTTTTKR